MKDDLEQIEEKIRKNKKKERERKTEDENLRQSVLACKGLLRRKNLDSNINNDKIQKLNT